MLASIVVSTLAMSTEAPSVVLSALAFPRRISSFCPALSEIFELSRRTMLSLSYTSPFKIEDASLVEILKLLEAILSAVSESSVPVSRTVAMTVVSTVFVVSSGSVATNVTS